MNAGLLVFIPFKQAINGSCSSSCLLQYPTKRRWLRHPAAATFSTHLSASMALNNGKDEPQIAIGAGFGGRDTHSALVVERQSSPVEESALEGIDRI